MRQPIHQARFQPPGQAGYLRPPVYTAGSIMSIVPGYHSPLSLAYPSAVAKEDEAPFFVPLLPFLCYNVAQEDA